MKVVNNLNFKTFYEAVDAVMAVDTVSGIRFYLPQEFYKQGYHNYCNEDESA